MLAPRGPCRRISKGVFLQTRVLVSSKEPKLFSRNFSIVEIVVKVLQNASIIAEPLLIIPDNLFASSRVALFSLCHQFVAINVV